MDIGNSVYLVTNRQTTGAGVPAVICGLYERSARIAIKRESGETNSVFLKGKRLSTQGHGFPLTASSLRMWEEGWRKPRAHTLAPLRRFLEEHSSNPRP